VNSEIRIFNEGFGPRPGDQVVLADKFTRTLRECDQDIERAATQAKRSIILEQRSLRRQKAKRSKCNRLSHSSNPFCGASFYAHERSVGASFRRTATAIGCRSSAALQQQDSHSAASRASSGDFWLILAGLVAAALFVEPINQTTMQEFPAIEASAE